MFKLKLFVFAMTAPMISYSTELMFFDRDMIVDEHIKTIYEKVSRYPDGKEPEDSGGPCSIYKYEFDSRGNIVSSGLTRLGTVHGYQYNLKNQLISWSWKDKGTNELYVFTAENYTQGNYKQEIIEQENYFNHLLTNKNDYRETYTREITDVCSSIDGLYSVQFMEGNNNLPYQYRASKSAELETFGDGDMSSPQLLYIYYEYEYFLDDDEKE